MPVVALEGEMLFYDEASTGTGPAMLLVHGAGGDHTHWPEALRRHPGMRVLAPDLPGHGRSSGRGHDSVAAYADIIGAFAEAMGLGRAVVAGHSMGGAVALTLAKMKPGWLEGVILVGTGARLRVDPRILEGLLTEFDATVGRVADMAFGPDAPAHVIDQVRRQLLKNDPRVIRGDYLACDRFDMMGGIGDIACPALVISAACDRMTPVKYGQYLHRNLSASSFALIPDAGHMMAVERPDEVIAAMCAFMGIPHHTNTG